MASKIGAITAGAKEILAGGAFTGEKSFYSHKYEKAVPYGTKNIQAGATYDPGTVDAEIILEEMFGYAWPQYPLMANVRVEKRDKIKFTARVATKPTGSEKVGRLVEPNIKESTYSDVDFTCWKNGVHLLKADEAELEASHDIMDLDIQAASRDIARMADSQIKTALEAATNTSAGNDWGAMTTAPNNDNDPWVDINTAITAIDDTNGWSTDTMYLSRLAWHEFANNTYVKDTIDIEKVNVSVDDLSRNRVFYLKNTAVGVGLKVVVSTHMTGTVAVLADSTAPALICAKGPTISEKYRLPARAGDGFIIWDYLQPLEVVDGALYKLTAVTA